MNQQKPQLNKEELGELNEKEVDLILTIRNEYRFGMLEIYVHDGVPQHILRTVKRKNLGNL